MSSFRNLSLRRKQMLIMMLTSTVSLMLACASFVSYDASKFRQEMVESMSSLAEVVGNNMTAAIDFNDPLGARQTLAALRGEPSVVLAHVHTPDDRVFATYVRSGAQLPTEFPHYAEERHEFTANHFHLFRPIMEGGEQIATIELIADLNKLRERIWRYTGIAILVLAVSLMAAFWLSLWLQKFVSNPILHLSQVARTVAREKNYSVRASKQSNDELGHLVDGFNEMLGQIQARDAALQSAHAELEARVEERTAELGKSNEALKTENAERKSAEEALRESEKRFSGAFEHAPIGMALVLPEGRWLQVNRVLCDLLGYTETELLALAFQDITHPEDLEADLENVRRLISGEILSYEMEKRYVHKNGVFVTVLLSVSLVRDGKGQPLYFIAQIQDITERKQSEARQQAEEKRYLRQRNALIDLAGQGPVDDEDLGNTIRRLTETSAATLGIDRVSVWRYNEDRSGIRCLDLYEMGTDRHSSGMELAALDYPAYFKVLAAREVISAEDAWQDVHTSAFSENYLRPLGITSMLDAPIELGGAAEGVLCHEHIGSKRKWTTDEETFAVAVANVVSLALEGSERKRAQAELENMHQQLMDASRRSGMAEIATNVLHNVGNVLNSVNVSSGLVEAGIRKSKVSSLARIVELLREHRQDLGRFFNEDAKGKQVPDYLATLSDHLVANQEAMIGELDSLRRNVDHIKEIVAMQQNYAAVGGLKEMIDVVKLVEDSISINEETLNRNHLKVIREYTKVAPLNLEKHKMLLILVNLISNANFAFKKSEVEDRWITVRVDSGDGRIRIMVIDNGVGIPPENLTRIFNYGFTTRKDGHGFGLHSSALAAKEMGGSLTAHSDGPDRGATFTLELPCLVEEKVAPHNTESSRVRRPYTRVKK